MNPSKRTSFVTISHPTQALINRPFVQRYRHSPSAHENYSLQSIPHHPLELDRISRSFNVKIYSSLDKSKYLRARKKSISSKKRVDTYEANQYNGKPKQVKRIPRYLPQSQSLKLNTLKGQGYCYVNNRLNRRNHVKFVMPVDVSKNKRVIPIEFQQQLRQANKSFTKQNLHDWMKHKRQDILNKVSQQIKLKSEFQKFLPQ